MHLFRAQNFQLTELNHLNLKTKYFIVFLQSLFKDLDVFKCKKAITLKLIILD